MHFESTILLNNAYKTLKIDVYEAFTAKTIDLSSEKNKRNIERFWRF